MIVTHQPGLKQGIVNLNKPGLKQGNGLYN